MDSISRWLVGSSRSRISGFLKQQLAQGNPGFLSAGEGVHRTGKIFLGETQAFQNAGQFAFISVAVFLLKGVCEPGVGFHQLLESRAGEMLHFRFHGPYFSAPIPEGRL